MQRKNQLCTPGLSIYFNCIQSILIWAVVVSVVVRGQGFVMSWRFIASSTDCQVKQA